MIVLPQALRLPAGVISSTVPVINTNPLYGEVEVAWVSGASYTANQVRVHEGRKFRRITDGSGTTPPLQDVLNWIDEGASNYAAMFDLHRNSKTVAASPLTVVLQPGQRIDTVALGGLEANTVEVTMRVAGVVVFNKTYNLSGRNTRSWSQYRFGKFTTKKAMIDFGLPRYSGAEITITFTSPTGIIKCGACVLGSSVFIGDVQSATGGSLNFSEIVRDGFGGAKFKSAVGAPKMSLTLKAPMELNDQIQDVKTALDGVPAVYCGLEDPKVGLFQMLLIFGGWQKFETSTENEVEVKINLDVEEI